MSGVNVGYGTYMTAASTARISLASSRQRYGANTETSVPITSAYGGSSDSGKIWALRGLTSTRSARPPAGSLMCATSFITDRASPWAPGNPFTRASIRIERPPPPAICPPRPVPGFFAPVRA